MSSVTVYSTAKMEELLNAGVVGASITSGHLYLHMRDESTIDVGAVLSGLPTASTSTPGIVELATDTETITGTDSTRAVTPFGLAAFAQPKDSDLTAIAALTGTNDNVIQRKSGAWTERTMAQLATDLAAAGEFPETYLHNGTAYVDADTTKIYIGPTDPGAVPNGSIWYDTTGA